MNTGVFSAEKEEKWLARFLSSGQSLRGFCRMNPTAPSLATLSRMVKKVKAGEVPGSGRSRHSRLSPEEIVYVLLRFQSVKKGGLPIARLARRLSDGLKGTAPLEIPIPAHLKP